MHDQAVDELEDPDPPTLNPGEQMSKLDTTFTF